MTIRRRTQTGMRYPKEAKGAWLTCDTKFQIKQPDGCITSTWMAGQFGGVEWCHRL
ncbi:MAG TPA: hypothetical protein VGN10_09395 [Pyrinomonadaceae bacterium]